MKPHVVVLFAASLFVTIAIGVPVDARQGQSLAPRNRSGGVLLQGPNPKDNGVWLPGPGVTGVPVKPVDQLPDQGKIYIFDIGGPHTFRTIYMDGRTHPKNGPRTAYGHSIGWWDGDTLVSDTTNFHEGFWLDRKGLPHTDRLHTVERWTRRDAATMEYSLTVDDPGAYTEIWTTSVMLRWEGNTELFEYICQQQNYAGELMVGEMKKVDRTTVVVP